MSDSIIEPKYQILFDTAVEALRKNAHPVKHSVGAAVLCASGEIYSGINIETSGYDVCAEPVALGAALSDGEKEISAVVAMANLGNGFVVLSPCGNCRQTLLDYAPEADVIYIDAEGVAYTKAKNLLPGAYTAPDFAEIK
jgi:cytidine deaminase